MGVLRFLLAISVVATHGGPLFGISFVGGRIAVQAFYIISGFYMTMILNEKYIGKNQSWKLFITNRFLRLYPIYLSVFLLTIILCLINGYFNGDYLRLTNYITNFKGFWAMLVVIVTNLVIIGQDIVMFLGVDGTSGSLYFTDNYLNSSPTLFSYLLIPQAWTIGIEIMFYIIAPFILRKSWKVVLSFLLLSFSIKLFTFYGLNLINDPWTYRFFPSEVMFFFIGYFSYRLMPYLSKIKLTGELSVLILIFVSLLTVFYYYIPNFGYSQFLIEGFYFFSVFITIPILFNKFKKSKLDIKIGELSYPIYISHLFVMMIVSIIQSNTEFQSVLVLIFTVLLSLLLNKFVANPIEKLRQSRLIK